MTAAVRDEPRIAEAFRSGVGISRSRPHDDPFGYRSHVARSWIPALDGVEAKLEAGVRVADVHCGDGTSTMVMADAFPLSDFRGFDANEQAIEQARELAAYRARFEVAAADDFPGCGYELITTFDCLHDFWDPVGAARHIRQALAPDGTWLIVEPFAGDRVEDNLNPIGRVYYAVSTLLCTPAAMAQDVGLALGAQAGESRLHDVVTAAGFTRFRRVAATPFHLVLEARP
jgi:SAM-dependent methyltransferase